ncbi:ankyrin repeat-containing protein At5g02620-like [Macadamia integrifolia]|uniref:ankyrin repeat-containing protein At5g02620-like n=1 Tax=Macadamia integrifolia TaxID=60698 RepID=UPI001C4F72B7|nr:ankyrin repeat-containing protein At5g02620-like [Macadamia integrifolia]
MDPQLYRAAQLGDITLLRLVVNEDPSRLLQVTPQENTAIHVSVSFGHTDFVKEVYAALLQHNSSLEGDTEYRRSLSLLTQVNSKGDTALHVTAREGHVSIAEFLIEKILPWPSDHDVESGNGSLAREKIRVRNKSKNTALHEAVRRNDLVMVNLLIRADPDDLGHPNYNSDAEGHGESPLFLAARGGYFNILNLIFHICPSPAHGGPHGRTALHVAVVEGHLDVVKLLLEKKGELFNNVDENGRTALHYAASKTWGHKIVQQLLRHDPSSVYQLDKDGLSPLHIAALESSIEVFRELVQRCLDSVELLDKKRRNVVHFAVMSKNLQKIRYALQQLGLKEIINQADDDGNTPFHHAAKQCSLVLMGHFSSNRRVDLNATNNNGQTATDIFVNLIPTDRLAVTLGLSMINLRTRATTSLRADYALSVRGEEKWRIGGANEEKTLTDPNNKQEEVAAAARSEVKQREKEMGKILQIVASLIATVTFAAVFQVPGGYNSDGKPMLLDNGSFQKFLQYDAIAMGSSVGTLFVMLIASVGSDLFYSLSLKVARILIYIALMCTTIAFLEGFRAVLPHCGSLLCFSGHSTRTFSIIAISVVVFMIYFPLSAVMDHFLYPKLEKLVRKNVLVL